MLAFIVSLLTALAHGHIGATLASAIKASARVVRRLIRPSRPRWAAPGSICGDIAIYLAAYAAGDATGAYAVAQTYWPAPVEV